MAMELENTSDKPLTFWMEPYGADYTLLHGQKAEIRCDNLSLNMLADGDVVVWAMGDDPLFEPVFVDDENVQCGFQREHSQSKGLRDEIA